MGGQAVHRYAILKKQKVYDDNMSYWVGNPGYVFNLLSLIHTKPSFPEQFLDLSKFS